MDKTIMMSKLSSGVFTAEEQSHMTEALTTQDRVDAAAAQFKLLNFNDVFTPGFQQRVGAFDWLSLLNTVLPIVLGLFTGGAGGALIPFINAILAIFKINPLPVPTPTPVPIPGPPAPFIPVSKAP